MRKIKYQILNTRKNLDQGLSYRVTDTKPEDTVDYNTLVWNGVFYLEDTVPEELSSLLNTLHRTKERCRFHYGDVKTGTKWGDVEVGRIGRTTGTVPVPITVYNSRSLGGPALLSSCVVKVETTKGKRILYQVKEA